MNISKKFLIIVGVIILAGLMTFLLLQPKKPAPRPAASLTPTASPSVSPDQLLIESLSKDLAEKYFTYRRPDDPAYLASIKPFLTTSAYRASSSFGPGDQVALAHSVPLTSTATVASTEITGNRAVSHLTVDTTEPTTGARYQQQVSITWVREGSLWHANAIQIDSTTKGT